MAKWDLSKLPEGRKPLPNEWFAERAQMQERIKELEERLKAATDDAKEADAYSGELEAKLEGAVKLIELAIELGRWELNPSFRDELIDFTTELTGGNDE